MLNLFHTNVGKPAQNSREFSLSLLSLAILFCCQRGHVMHREIQRLLQIAKTSPHPSTAQSAFSRARDLMSQADHSQGAGLTGGATRPLAPVPHSVIQTDQIHPPNSGDFIQPLMAPSRYLVVPAIPAVAPATDSPGETLRFSAGGGWLIGWRATAIDFTAGIEAAGEFEQASMGVRIFLNDGEEIITNGTSADFARFSDLFGAAVQWSPLMRRVDVKDVMSLQFRNFQPAASGSTLQPSVTFAFWRERYPGTG